MMVFNHNFVLFSHVITTLLLKQLDTLELQNILFASLFLHLIQESIKYPSQIRQYLHGDLTTNRCIL